VRLTHQPTSDAAKRGWSLTTEAGHAVGHCLMSPRGGWRREDRDVAGARTASGNYDRAKAQRLFWGTRFWRWCARCSARSRQREALSRLDDRLLEDIGVTRQQANAEAAKPFWK
jgi:uncharacterized protein YjiS (DUF1127 family)